MKNQKWKKIQQHEDDNEEWRTKYHHKSNETTERIHPECPMHPMCFFPFVYMIGWKIESALDTPDSHTHSPHCLPNQPTIQIRFNALVYPIENIRIKLNHLAKCVHFHKIETQQTKKNWNSFFLSGKLNFFFVFQYLFV